MATPPSGAGWDMRFRVRTSILDATAPVVAATWTFGDGTSEEGESLTKVYAAPGVFTVRATTVQRAVDVIARRG